MPAGSPKQQSPVRDVNKNMKYGKTLLLMTGAALLTAGACSPRIYRPPALGAEYRFDEGLQVKNKRKQQLFDPAMRRDLEKEGKLPAEGKPASGVTAVTRRDSTGNRIGAGGAVRTDTLTSPASSASPASPDSSHSAGY